MQLQDWVTQCGKLLFSSDSQLWIPCAEDPAILHPNPAERHQLSQYRLCGVIAGESQSYVLPNSLENLQVTHFCVVATVFND